MEFLYLDGAISRKCGENQRANQFDQMFFYLSPVYTHLSKIGIKIGAVECIPECNRKVFFVKVKAMLMLRTE